MNRNFLGKWRLILASQSPRRSELLGMLALPFEVAPKLEIEETYPATLAPEEIPEYLACLKGDAYAGAVAPDTLVLTADTVVILDGEVLGKPHTLEEAKDMLHRLSGHTHTVVTGCAITWPGGRRSFSTSTEVEFDELPSELIDYYVERYKPLDKAGAYGIQEWVGAAGIKRIDGSFYNVMGLPVNRLWHVLSEISQLDLKK